MSEYGTSFFTPNVPIPDPPGANFFVKLPVYLIGIFFAFYAAYSIYLEFVDYERMKNPEAFSIDDGGIPAGNPILLPHPGANDPQKCTNCHFPPLTDAAKEILEPEQELDFELPPEIDPDIFDDEKFYQMLRGEEALAASKIVGDFRGGESCLSCHSQERFDLEHLGHRIQPFESCTICHNIHNPFVRPLLSRKPEDLCLQCHEYP